MEGVTELTNAMAKRRQQGNRDQNAGQKAGADDSWVFNLDIEKDVRQWIKN
jgi:hypothetical protein